ncbi:Chitinase [hydrothermal vent metagenome]|uniref:Chitinase n=1 Tax=hydrothermal vent metagenome TaxID=652676 RepID=A0A1W1CSF4_9ZZZZ
MNVIWQKSPSKNKMTWNDAIAYCQNLVLDGIENWRVPSYKELYYLADRTKYAPAIEHYFNLETSSWYWSNTAYKIDISQAWIVNFNNGYDKHRDKSYTYLVRCVQ